MNTSCRNFSFQKYKKVVMTMFIVILNMFQDLINLNRPCKQMPVPERSSSGVRDDERFNR